MSLSTEFCAGNSDILEEVIIYRYYGQKIPYFGRGSFSGTTFQGPNITYIYSVKALKSNVGCISSILSYKNLIVIIVI